MKQSKTFYEITNSTLLIKKRLRHRCFPVNFAKFLKTPFFTEHVRASVSGKNLTKFFFQSRLESHCSWHNRIIFKYLFIYCCTNVRFVVINSDRYNFISQPSTGPSDLLVFKTWHYAIQAYERSNFKQNFHIVKLLLLWKNFIIQRTTESIGIFRTLSNILDEAFCQNS